jgi:hypothetical protein
MKCQVTVELSELVADATELTVVVALHNVSMPLAVFLAAFVLRHFG